MPNAQEIKAVWSQMSQEEKDSFIASLSDEEAGKLADALSNSSPTSTPQSKESAVANIFRTVADPINQLKGAYYGIPRGLKDIAEGLDQATIQGLETLTGKPWGMGGSSAERTAVAETGRKQFANIAAEVPQAEGWRTAAKIAVPFALPGGGQLNALRGILYSGGLGALLASTEYQAPGEEQSRLSKAAGMGLLNAALRGGIEAGRAFPVVVKKALQTPIAQEGAALSKATGTELSLGQITGNRTIASIEEGLKGTNRSHALLDKQLNQAGDYMETVARQYANQPWDKLTESSGKMLGSAASKALRTYERVRAAASNVAYGKFRQAAGDSLIPVKNLLTKLDEYAGDVVPGTPESSLIAAANRLKRQVSENGNKGITASQLLKWREKISQDLFKHLDKRGRGFAQKELMDALFTDANAYSGKAADQLKTAIETYRKGSEVIDGFKQQLPVAVFGKVQSKGKMPTFDPYAASTKIETLTPPKIRGIRDAIAPHNPEAWDSVVGATIQRGLEKASRSTAKLPGEATLSPEKFLEEFPSPDRLREMIPDPAKRKALETGLSLFNRISTKFGGGGGQGIGVRQGMADVAINVVSQNPAFVARAAGKWLGPLGLSHLMMTPGGHKVLRALATESENSVAYTRAIDTLINDYYEPKPSAEQ